MRRSGGAATWLVFLLPLRFIFAVCAGSARADEADASLLRTKAWLAELDEFAAALSAMPELRLSGMDNDRLRALAALLHLPPEPEEGAGESENAPVSSGAPSAYLDIKPRLFRLMRRDDAVDRVESAVYGLDRLLRAVWQDEAGESDPESLPEDSAPDDSSGEGLAALSDYLHCVFLLAYVETGELEREEGIAGPDSSSLSVSEPPAGNEGRASRQDALLLALDAALSHELPSDSVRPLQVIKAGLLLEQARPQAALQALAGLDAGHDATPRGKRLRVRGLYLRSLALMRSGNVVLAKRDLDKALELAPDAAELRLARGTLLRMRGETKAMCGDFYAACAAGLCEGLKVAREQGYCGAGGGNEQPATPFAPPELTR